MQAGLIDGRLLYTGADHQVYRGSVDSRQQSLDQFLAGVERQAFRMAEIATRNPDDALDIVQDAMIKLVERYANKPEQEWRPLFFTILNSRIVDYHRKSTLTSRLFGWLGADDEPEDLPLAPTNPGPDEIAIRDLAIDSLLAALDSLPMRQQQVFMLRHWQGFNVSETAKMLKCSEGSVKTHLSRAMDAVMASLAAQEGHES